MNLETAVRAAAGGDLDAFAEITRRFQHMAFGYALSFVRDLGQAEDIVQEAFVGGLVRLADPGRSRSVRRLASGHRAPPRAPSAATQAPRGIAADRGGRRGHRRAGPGPPGGAPSRSRRRAGGDRRAWRGPSARSSRSTTSTTAPIRTSRPSWAYRSRRSTTGCTPRARSSKRRTLDHGEGHARGSSASRRFRGARRAHRARARWRGRRALRSDLAVRIS